MLGLDRPTRQFGRSGLLAKPKRRKMPLGKPVIWGMSAKQITSEGSAARVALNWKENRMPTYVCSAAIGRLTPIQKAEIVRSITAIHHEETGAPRYLVQVIFYDLAPDSHYVAGQPARADQIWIRADIRGGRTNEQKSQMLRRIMQGVGRASGAAEDAVWVYLCDIPAANIAEYGRVLLPPGEEDAWFSSLPDAMRERLRPLA